MSKLHDAIVLHLTEKGTYDPSIDDYLIEELIDNIALCKKCFQSLKQNGVTLEYIGTSGSTMTKINPEITCYIMLTKNISTISQKLSINRADRLKLKILDVKAQDEFEQIMNS